MHGVLFKLGGCGYEVLGIILFQAFLNSHSLLRGITFKLLPLRKYVLSPTMLSPLETFLELLLWNSFQRRRHISLDVFSIQVLFLETTRRHSEPNQGNRVRVPFQLSTFGPETFSQRAPFELEHRYGGETNRWSKFQALFYTQLRIMVQYFHIIISIDCLAL
jgi:hypothetical protein